MTTTLVLSRKKRGVRPRLCQLRSKSDYAPIKTKFSDQVRLTCHFVIFPIGITTEDKVTSAVTVQDMIRHVNHVIAVSTTYKHSRRTVTSSHVRDAKVVLHHQRTRQQGRGTENKKSRTLPPTVLAQVLWGKCSTSSDSPTLVTLPQVPRIMPCATSLPRPLRLPGRL